MIDRLHTYVRMWLHWFRRAMELQRERDRLKEEVEQLRSHLQAMRAERDEALLQLVQARALKEKAEKELADLKRRQEPTFEIEGSDEFREVVRQACRLLAETTFLDFLNESVKTIREGVVADNPHIWAAAWPIAEHTVTFHGWVKDPLDMAAYIAHEAAHVMSYRLGLLYYGRAGEYQADAVRLAFLAARGEWARAKRHARPFDSIPEASPLRDNPPV